MSNPNFEVLLISRLTLKIRHFIFATSGFIFNEKDKKGKKKKIGYKNYFGNEKKMEDSTT